MLDQRPHIVSKKKRVKFRLEDPEADEVKLLIRPNPRCTISQDMQKDALGVWHKAKVLQPGRYWYTFLVDGERVNNSGKDKTAPRRFRTSANELVVYTQSTHEV